MRRWVLRAAMASTAATIGLVATGAVLGPVAADTPTKVAWWNAASASGQAAPAPDATTGGIRVAVAPQESEPASYGAVEYALPAGTTGTLELSITQISPQPPQPPANPAISSVPPTGNVQACPTKADTWKAGDDQPIADAPAYDCSTYHFAGALSSDNKTMTFLVDSAADVSPGVLSLAIVPVTTTGVYEVGTDTGTDSTPPFFVDFDKPSATSLTADLAPPVYTPPPPVTTGGGSVTPTVPLVNTNPAPVTPSISLPGTTTTVPGASAPVVATQPQTQQQIAAAPAAKSSASPNHDTLLVLLILILFSILYMQNMERGSRWPSGLRSAPMAGPTPAAAGAAAAGAGTVAAVAGTAAFMPYPTAPVRGVGRHIKPRASKARPLT